MKKSKIIAMSGIATALSLVCLYLTVIMPIGKLSIYVICSFPMMLLLYKKSYIASIMTYIGTCLLGFLIIGNPIVVLPYLFFFGIHSTFTYFLDNKLKKPILKWTIKIIYAAITLVLLWSFAAIAQLINVDLPLYWLLPLGLIVFVLYDLLYRAVMNQIFKKLKKSSL